MLHGLWDLNSPHVSDVGRMPAWAEPACVSFDFLVGGYLLARHLPASDQD